ncbi:unnamed protein product [Rodentolepis nana]|uniref:Mediator complex subunit 1 n=1 Tax=Rodentolepis nana TaxID=102285 RepID=A0A0R3TRP9_RODNA|nr:unnamed protein product [Rodentolepis nana]
MWAHLSLNSQNRCVLRLGLHPGPFGLKEKRDVESLPINQQQRERDLFENPHCLIREHLEFLVERQKSIILLCKCLLMLSFHLLQFLSSTSDFMVTMEALRKPTIINNISRSPIVVQSARPVRSMSLMALSCCDLNLVYRGTLCLRLTYKIPEHGDQGLVFFSDGCHNLDLGANSSPQKGGGISSEIYPVQGFVPLPAFKQFLDSMKKAFNVEEGSMPFNAFTVSQLDRIVTNSKADPEDPLAVTISPLEKYFSSSLIFHASNQVMNSLRWQISAPLDIDTGEFTAKSHPDKGIEVKVKMYIWDDPVEGNLPSWRLQLKVSSDLEKSYTSNESGEFSAKIEEFFSRRVCSVSPQASAITSFFRLMTLPFKTLYDLVSNVFAWDLDGGSSTTGTTNSSTSLRVGLVSFTSAAPEPSVVLSMPHTLIMQIILTRPNTALSSQQEIAPGTSMASQRNPRVEVLTLTYDTAKNVVAVLGPSKKPQKSRYSALEDMVNQRFRNTQACTLVQFISHLRQGGPIIQQQQQQQQQQHAPQPSQQMPPQPQTQQLQSQQMSQQMHQPMQQ